MLLNVPACELVQVRSITQANLLGFLLSVFDGPTIAQDSSNHPERSHANGGGAVNKRRPVLRVVSDPEELCGLFFFGIRKRDGNVEVAQAQLFGFRLFFGRAIFAWLAEVNDCLDAFGFEFFKMLELRLPARAEVFVDAEKVSDRVSRFLGCDA